MKNIKSYLLTVFILVFLFYLPSSASEHPSIIDEADLIPDDQEIYIENRIEIIKETYDYSITLVSKEIEVYENLHTTLSSFSSFNPMESGVVFFMCPYIQGGYEWDFAGYGSYSDVIGSSLVDVVYSSAEYNEAYAIDQEEFYLLMYADFLTNIEFFLEQQTGIPRPDEVLLETESDTLISGFDPLIDAADLFSDTEEQSLFKRIEYLYTTYNFDFTLLTMDYVAKDESLLTYCDYYEGLDPTRDGLVFGISMDPSYRNYATSTRNLGMLAFTEDALDVIDEEVAPLLTEKRYYEALNLYFDHTEEFLDLAQNGRSYSAPLPFQVLIAWLGLAPAIIAFVFAYSILHGVFLRQMKTAVIQTHAKKYLKKDSFILTLKRDDFIREKTIKHYNPPKKRSSGGGSGGSRSGFGGSRGGRSGRF